MKISGFLKQTAIDYDGKIAAEIFTKGCNFNCPSCHSRHIVYGKEIDFQTEIFPYLVKAKGFIDALVICGGEPTIYKSLPDFAKRIKDMGLAVKLDTNGSNPSVLGKLLKDKLVDYVAMDVKGSRELYPVLTGVKNIDIEDIEKSMKFLFKSGIGYEFRTTVVPVFRDDKLEFMTVDDVVNTAKWIVKTGERNDCKYYLQKFIAREKEMMNKRFSRENLPEQLQETPDSLLCKMRDAVREYLPNCEVR